jgi:hypothetical protein
MHCEEGKTMTTLHEAAMRQALEALEKFEVFRRIMTDGPDTSDKLLAEDYAEMAFVQGRTAIEALRSALAQQGEQDRQLDQLLKERDHRDEIINKLCDAVLGTDRYEWSSMYFFEDAVREVEERMCALAPQGEPVAWYSDDWKIICRADERVFWKSVAVNPLYDAPAPQAQQGEPVAQQEPQLLTETEIVHVKHLQCACGRCYSLPSLPPLRPAPQAQPLTNEQIKAGRIEGYGAEDAPDAWDFEQGVRFAERHHGIGEKQ